MVGLVTLVACSPCSTNNISITIIFQSYCLVIASTELCELVHFTHSYFQTHTYIMLCKRNGLQHFAIFCLMYTMCKTHVLGGGRREGMVREGQRGQSIL